MNQDLSETSKRCLCPDMIKLCPLFKRCVKIRDSSALHFAGFVKQPSAFTQMTISPQLQLKDEKVSISDILGT
jgi:hypothetical protein